MHTNDILEIFEVFITNSTVYVDYGNLLILFEYSNSVYIVYNATSGSIRKVEKIIPNARKLKEGTIYKRLVIRIIENLYNEEVYD